MKIFIGTVLCLGFFGMSQACVLDASEVLVDLKQKPPRELTIQLWDAGKCEDALLTGLSSGKQAWIDLALALRPHTDAWASESLGSALSFAMQNAPARMLRLVDNPGIGTAICIPYTFDDSDEGIARVKRAQIAAERMYKTFLKTRYASQARKCLQALAQGNDWIIE